MLVVRVQEHVPGFPAGTTACLVLDEEPPPPELTVMARVLAFADGALLMVRKADDERAWSPPPALRAG